MKIFKVIIEETSSVTAYIQASDEEDAKNKAIYSDIESYENQDFEQKIIRVETLSDTQISLLQKRIN